MLTLSITREQMLTDINDYLTGRLESMTCSCETSLQPNASYIEINKWTNLKGEVVQLCIPGHAYIQGYRNHQTSIAPDWILDMEARGNSTFVERFWKYIKDI